MNFKEAYERFLDGTANSEEIEFVRSEMKRAREIDTILDSAPSRAIFHEPEKETIKKAKKQFNFRNTLRMIVVVLCVLALLAAAICAYIFGTAIPAAKRNSEFSREQALVIAQEFLTEFLGKDASGFPVHDIDRHLYTERGLRNAVYCYEIELRDGMTEYEVTVNAASGYATITDIDHHD
ncbi:MAG: PepSY domain-containing protein [Clostridia bacterium]|nr:PepSY domain-containing protein [Clostridia bacterium]